MAYNELIKDTNVISSMSRAGKPTDNPVNEALNGWIKEELIIDFGIEQCREKGDFRKVMEKYVRFYNEQRPCFAIGYDTPSNYRRRYNKGEIGCKDTFEKRKLTTEPKFVQRRRDKALCENNLGNVSTFENANEAKILRLSTLINLVELKLFLVSTFSSWYIGIYD